MARLIDADALLKRLVKKKAESANKRYTEGFNDALMRFRSMVSTAPTIEPIKHGRWIPHPEDDEWDICTACGVGTKRREHGFDASGSWETEYSYHYCPNCGADMRGGEE